MLVEVRPLPINRWHGKKGKESFAQAKGVEVLYDPTTSKYATGLTKEEAEEYGKLLGVDLSDRFNPNEPHPYWSTKPAFMVLKNQTMVFNTDKPEEFVKVKNMKASNRVANSMKEYEEGKFPDATHVIIDEQEEMANKASKIAGKNTAREMAFKMSAEDKIAMIRILSEKSFKGRSQNFIDVEIDDIIDNKAPEFLKYARMGREEVTARATVLELLYKNILTKEGSAIYYMGDMISADYEGAVVWLKDPNNSKIKVSILEKLNK